MRILTCLVFLALVITASAQTATTTPVGYNSVTCLPNSDTYCAVPFCQSIDFQGLVSGNPTVTPGTAATFSTQALVTWTANQFQSLYFVRMLSGTKAGMYYQVTANSSATNSAGTLTIDLAGDDFAGVANNDSFMLCKFWTLGTLFPPATQTTIVASSSTLGPARRTELLLPDMNSTGINLAASKTYFISGTTNGQWRESNTGFPSANNVILLPDGYFIVRHNKPLSITNPTTFTVAGSVELNPVTMPLSTAVVSPTNQTGKQDNPVSTGRPVPVKLKDLDLISTGAFVASAGTLGPARRDELLVFDNAVAAVNRSSSATYFYNSVTSNWRQATTGFPIADDVEIAASTGLLIRKYKTVTGTSVMWTHAY